MAGLESDPVIVGSKMNNAVLDNNAVDQALWIRRAALVAIYHAGSGHPGGALSCADLLAEIFNFSLAAALNRSAEQDRDRLILSKGHSCPALYAAAACHGIVDLDSTYRLRKLGSPAQGHPDIQSWAWLEASTGSLGQGFSVATGMALAARMKGFGCRIYAILGDGELQEGQVWEAAMFASHFGLSNLCAIVDYNKLQSDDRNANVMGLEPLADKWRNFGWRVEEIDGHDRATIRRSLETFSEETGRPTVVVAHTVKGKGISFMEDDPAWHGSVKISEEQIKEALCELGVGPGALAQWLSGQVPNPR